MAKKALISIREKRETGYRISDVVNEENQFGVDENFLFWIVCPENITENNKDKFWYDPSDSTCKLIPTTSPHTGWIFNETSLEWEAPIPRPNIGEDNKAYYWNNETQNWVK
jgi:hypothetical protein